jgi:hypothetical protein
MSVISSQKANFQEQLEKSKSQFESQLIRLELGKEQIESQTLPELEQSLERINDALKNPDSFGTVRLKLVADIGFVVAKTGAEANYEIGVVLELPRFSGDMRAFGMRGTSVQGFVPIG